MSDLQTREKRNSTSEVKYHTAKKIILATALLIFIIAGLGISIFCRTHLRLAEQEMLNEQHKIERAWITGAVETVHAWENTIKDQIRHVSRAETFQLFLTDFAQLPPEDQKIVISQEELDNDEHPLQSVTTELVFLVGLLKDTANVRGWQSAAIYDSNALPVIAPNEAPAAADDIAALIREAASSRHTVFSPISTTEGNLFITAVEPMYKALSNASGAIMGYLVVSLPLNEPIGIFLSSDKVKDATFSPGLLVDTHTANKQIVHLENGQPVLRSLPLEKADSINAFARRPSLITPGHDAWSLGEKFPELSWHLFMEKSAVITDQWKHDQKIKTYTLGILGDLGIALLLGLICGGTIGNHFRKLYTTINDQKQVLESVNSSIQAGIALIKGGNTFTMSNPAFDAFVSRYSSQDDILKHVNEAMAEEKHSSEVWIDAPNGEERLLQMDVFPFHSLYGSKDKSSTRDCVAIFKDITDDFMRKAEEERQRQLSCVAGLVHCIECALDGPENNYLQGRSRHLEMLAQRLVQEMNLDEKSAETLRLASMLSQIGKLFVPRELMLSSRVFTDEERRTVRMAPYYAHQFLEGIRFTYNRTELPVADVVYQMGGHVVLDSDAMDLKPLTPDEMLPEARILFAANVFCAMTGQRAHRTPLTVAEAKQRMTSDSGSFAEEVLRAIIAIPDEELRKIMES
jgi:HD-GYP domain-containing protein (c-di-GMP phosphodiesterase class II)